MKSNRIKKHIDRLLLDPNNYRFIDRADYKFVPEGRVAEDRIQLRTFNFLSGKNNENIKDLISSFTTNGFLDIDQIQVKAIDDKYLVLEGNRRIATLKHLYEEFKKGNDVGKLEEVNFKSIDLVEIVDEDPIQHLITMGLHHISGKKRWSAVNEAQLIDDLLHKYNKSEQEICDALGISKTSLRRSTRTLSFIQQYKQSDYSDQFKTEMYSIFETVISNPLMKQWIGWDDDDYEAKNKVNAERLFSWISETEEIEREGVNGEQKIIKDPIITQYRQIKDLAYFIFDEKAIARMEESRSITEGYTFSEAVGEAKLRNALEDIKSSLTVAYSFKDLIVSSDYSEIIRIKSRLDELIPISKALIFINEKRASQHFDEINKHFTNLRIANYRKLEDVTIKNLKKVNIFAGGNNLGKTSVLESFYLLSQLNDITALLELERYRGKFLAEFHSKWIDKNFINNVQILGYFNGVNTSLEITKEPVEDSNIEKIGYLDTISAEAIVGNKTLSSSIHLFANKAPELRFTKAQVLCRAAFTSPYRYNEKLLHAAHKLAVENRYFDKVIKFINEHLDKDIEKIDLVNDEGENRFRVTSKKIKKAVDLTKYGEGLQRVFEIALLLGYCRNGILCVDEIDSAIHKSLLVSFTRFIQQTAADFNVQVFLSTHSKECIDAFVENDFPDDELTAYALTNENGKVVCRYLDGNKLKHLVESINIDIR